MWLIDRERKQPGSIWSLLACLTTFILLCVALGGLASQDDCGIKSIFVADLDFTNANWQRIIPDTEITSGGFLPVQRLNLWNNCNGDRSSNGDFHGNNPYKTSSSTTLDPRYAISHQINPGTISRADLSVPNGAMIKRSQAGAIAVLTTIACVLNGIGFFCQLFNVKGSFLPKGLAVIFLLVANTMVNVLAKRMVHAFNDNYNAYGVKADLGNKYLSIIWNAFGLLFASTALQFTRCRSSCGKEGQDTSAKFDPEAMKEGYQSSNYGEQWHNKKRFDGVQKSNSNKTTGSHPGPNGSPPPAYKPS